jgi:hypothetical protein
MSFFSIVKRTKHTRAKRTGSNEYQHQLISSWGKQKYNCRTLTRERSLDTMNTYNMNYWFTLHEAIIERFLPERWRTGEWNVWARSSSTADATVTNALSKASTIHCRATRSS